MNRKSKIKSGDKFNRLTVIEFKGMNGNHQRMWLCNCECGNQTTVRATNIFNGAVKSCGCINNEIRIKRLYKHGKSRTSEYWIWASIKTRTNNITDCNYYKYGAIGIKMCERWFNSFENFIEDMGERPSKKHTIDRINNNGNYEPSNCRWATWEQQSTNKRTTRFFIIEGKQYVLRDVCTLLNIPHSTLRNQLKTKTIEQIINTKNTKK